jgi:RimJ/RimL family protein N-acetyltransferase
MKLRSAKEEDSPDIFRWRNDPVAVANSLSRREVALSEHLEWFSRSLTATEDLILVGEVTVDGLAVKVGVCRFTSLGSGSYVVSINVDPGFRARGIGRTLLAESVRFLFAQREGTLRIHAQIIEKNTLSRRLFAGQGFREVSRDGDVVNYALDRESLPGGLGLSQEGFH